MQSLLGALLTIILMFQTMFGLIGEKYDVVKDIRYGSADRDLVTLYIPRNAQDRDENACVLFIHGGSWTGGEKEDMAPHCKRLAMKGYITATMSYSLCAADSDVTVYTMLDEVESCIGAIKAYGEENELNITKLATSGYSAGGHISMLYSYSRAESSPIELAFTANRVGPSDMSVEAWGNASYSLTSMLTGVPITDEMKENGEAAQLSRDISPVCFVDEATMPSLFAYAGKDPLVTAGNRESMVSVFEAAFGDNGNGYDYIYYPNSGHGLLLDPISEHKYNDTMLRYCQTYFGY